MKPHIALCGKARAGKDLAGRHLVERHGYTRVAFADGVRDVALAIDPMIEWPRRLSSIVRRRGWDGAKRIPEVRRLLQVVGTEAGRNVFGPDVWVDLAMRRAADVDGPVVFTDCRFPNEAEAVARLGGIVVRIERDGAGLDIGAEHASETALDGYRVDHVVQNNGTPAELFEAFDAIVAPPASIPNQEDV